MRREVAKRCENANTPYFDINLNEKGVLYKKINERLFLLLDEKGRRFG